MHGFIDKDSKMKVMNSDQHKLKPKIVKIIKGDGAGRGGSAGKLLDELV